MATRKPPKATRPADTRKRDRLALSPSPALRAALSDLSEAIGEPPATVALQMLTELIPQLHGLAKVVRAAKAGNSPAAKRALAHMLGDSLADAMASQQPDLYGRRK
jgi:hypothetical protein